MKNSSLRGFLLLFFILAISHTLLYSQDCTVSVDALKGTYKGDCKKGKAHGKGKAIGTDTYDGEFKSGLPDGEGTYTWSNGNSYTGMFEKGLKNGYGVMTIKMVSEPDSTLKGYWKKDIYKGISEYPYKVLSKTRKITRVEIRPDTKRTAGNEITIWISSTMTAAPTLANPVLPKVEISNLIIQKGGYARMDKNDTYSTKSETHLYDVWFPLSLRIEMGAESVDVEILEENSYLINITLNQ